MSAKRIMVQGTGSHVGKSVLVTGLCRLFAQDGYRVAPFKAQNMALNSFVTGEGGEMGRSQVVQAEAAGVPPHVDMNPILLKPTGEMRSQVIVRGKAIGTMSWREYAKLREELLREALAAFERLAANHDIVVIEGAGSPAEVNLRAGEIVNMRIARETGAPVYLVTDIDRGGAIAWVVGTVELLPPEERALIKGIVFNKFRGDVEILRPALDFLAERTGIPTVGVLPYLPDLDIAEEDSVALETGGPNGAGPADAGQRLDVAVVHLPRISNFTDVDALRRSPDVAVRFVRPGRPLGTPDLVILPGSKNTIDDLYELRRSGLAEEVRRYAGAGGCVVGICGGYQMLGLRVADPHHTESDRGECEGLGLLPVTTTLFPDKVTTQAAGTAAFPGNAPPVSGYEIHSGRTERLGGRPWLRLRRGAAESLAGAEGALDDGCFLLDERGQAGGAGGRAIFGTYLHGIFDRADFRRAFLDFVRRRKGWEALGREEERRADPYDVLASAVRAHLDVEHLYRTLA